MLSLRGLAAARYDIYRNTVSAGGDCAFMIRVASAGQSVCRRLPFDRADRGSEIITQEKVGVTERL